MHEKCQRIYKETNQIPQKMLSKNFNVKLCWSFPNESISEFQTIIDFLFPLGIQTCFSNKKAPADQIIKFKYKRKWFTCLVFYAKVNQQKLLGEELLPNASQEMVHVPYCLAFVTTKFLTLDSIISHFAYQYLIDTWRFPIQSAKNTIEENLVYLC